MSNEEKARKIVDNIFSTGVNTHVSFYEMSYDSAIRMSEWKEKQMIEFIDDEINLIDTCLLKKAETKEMLYRYEGIIDGLLRVKNKIINK